MSSPSGERIITETASLRMAESLMSNYRDAQGAVHDLVDNAVDNRITGIPLRVGIRLSKREIVIRNVGGEGLDFDGLAEFLNWGHSSKTDRDIGQYGVGGKSAMGFLGKSITVACSPRGSDVEFRIHDADWKTKGEVTEKQHRVQEGRAFTNEGYFIVTIGETERLPNPKLLIARLGDTYRPLLLDGSVDMAVNGTKVPPLDIKYMESSPDYMPERATLMTGFGDTVDLKVGVLEPGQRVKPGMRIYYRGRLVRDQEYFGMPEPAKFPAASRLIGEVMMDQVRVTTNKSDVIEDARWEDASKLIYLRVLNKWVAKLEALGTDQANQIEQYEKDIVIETKRSLEEILAKIGLIGRGLLPGSMAGGEAGTGGGGGAGSEGQGGGKGGRRKPDSGEAGDNPNRKRWGAFDEWDCVPMGNSVARSAVLKESGKDVLKINTDASAYQARKKAGDSALRLYVAETALMEIVAIATAGQPADQFITMYNEHYAEVGKAFLEEQRGGSRRNSPRR